MAVLRVEVHEIREDEAGTRGLNRALNFSYDGSSAHLINRATATFFAFARFFFRRATFYSMTNSFEITCFQCSAYINGMSMSKFMSLTQKLHCFLASCSLIE